jgi:palmitoyltransferase ZDHHC6
MHTEGPVNKHKPHLTQTMAVRSLLHWGPLIALGIILTLAVSTLYIVFWALPPPSAWMLVYMSMWATLVVIILVAFFRAMYTGPGTVPLGWVRCPESSP